MATKILVSQPKPQTEKSPYFEVANKYKIELVFRPFIKIEPMSAKDFRQQKVSIPGHTAIVFTSRHAIDHFFALCKELRVTIPDDMKYFCVSEQVSLYIQKYVQYRKRKNFFPETGLVTDLMPIIAKHGNEKYFVPQSSAHTDDMRRMLDETGVEHDEAVMYYTVANDFTPDEAFDYNMLVVGSHHALHAQEHVPDWWGILSVEKTEQGLDFYQVRPWQPNPRLNFINKLGFLWRMELAHIQELNGMYKYADRSKDFVIEKIYASVERPLLARQISDELFERDYTTAAQKIEEYRKEHGRSGRSRRKAGARRRRRRK